MPTGAAGGRQHQHHQMEVHPKLQLGAPPLSSTADVERHITHAEAAHAAAVTGALQHGGQHVAAAAHAAELATHPADLVDDDSAVTYVKMDADGEALKIATPINRGSAVGGT
jgi:hypothetical protein